MILIGGKTWRNQSFETNYTLIELVKKFKNNPNKVVGAICDAAYFLATNGLLNDCKHTVNNLAEIKDNENYTNSENFVKTESVIDGKMVTARGDNPLHFAKDVMKALGDIPEKNINLLNGNFVNSLRSNSTKFPTNLYFFKRQRREPNNDS